MHNWFLRLLLTIALVAGATPDACALACVWKVTDADGHTLYLAGSVHSLRATDYPLPPEYDQAYAASSAISVEWERSTVGAQIRSSLGDNAHYPMNGRLKDHVDPRTYAYILRVINAAHGASQPEKNIEHLRAWALAFLVESPGGVAGVSSAWGVEPTYLRRAAHDGKERGGLVRFSEHIAIFSHMNDADSEATLLLAFIDANTAGRTYEQTVANWKRGDIAAIGRMVDNDYADARSLQRRMLTERNHAWIPRIEGYLRSRKTWMVIAGTAHMAGEEGVPQLLRSRGYKVEQL